MNLLSTIFSGVLAVSWAASWLILAVVLARWIGARRLPARYWFAAWLVLAVALLVPFRLSLPVKALKMVAPQSGLASAARLITAVPLPPPSAVAPTFHSAATTVPVAPAGPSLSVGEIAALLWLAGVIGLGALRTAASCRFRRKLKEAMPVALELQEIAEREARLLGLGSGPALVTSEAVAEPVLFGIWRPRLIFPPGLAERLDETELRFVVLHELGHCQRRDLAAQALMQFAAIVHWFNPLPWLAAHLARLDCELACDDLVLRQTRPEHRRGYGAALLRVLEMTAGRKRRALGLAILNARQDLEQRIRSIASYGRASRWATALGAVALALLATAAGTRLAWAQSAAETGKAADDPTRKKITARGVTFVVADPAAWSASPPRDFHDLSLPLTEVTHLSFVIDASGSMRDELTGLETQVVLAMFDRLLQTAPRLQFFQIIDADGRHMLKGSSPANPWVVASPEKLAAAREEIRTYSRDNTSDPVPGILQAYRSMRVFSEPRPTFGIWVLGDEMTERTSDEDVIDRLSQASPASQPDQPRIALSAVNFLGRGPLGGSTFSQKRYTQLFQHLARESGGIFISVVRSAPSQYPQTPATSSAVPMKVSASLPAAADEQGRQDRAYQQDLAERRRRDVLSEQDLNRRLALMDPAAAFDARIEAATYLAANGRFGEAARVYNQAIEAAPSGLASSDRAIALRDVIKAQVAPVDVTINSDGKTWIIIAGFRQLKPIEKSTIKILPGNYEVIGRRPGYQDVHLSLRLRSDEPSPGLQIACTQPVAPNEGR